ncbi:cell division protein FtsX [Paracoccus jeotgali]|uniref:Cell division protein FtsX n=1 Tax=Paracoccus jeotgali TaxID=2065379 RepID=A0A2K9MGF5_9RHOB|nr:cell division protein FtsX [Paracoccus jeotgali]AUM74690.1 cell division protein FtsX [Paracoccus jeotgali]
MRRPDLRHVDWRSLWRGLVIRDTAGAGRIVPPTGFTAQLTLLTAGAMAFLAVFALALSMATGRLADRWSQSLAQTVTIRVSAPADRIEAQTGAVMAMLKQTPGIAEARMLPQDELESLLTPWFGPDVPIEALPVPRLIEIRESGGEFDAEALRLRLEAEVPGAVLDDHTRWRQPLIAAANRLRLLGIVSLGLIAAAGAAMMALAAQSSLAANGQVIRVLRLIGARDVTIAQAFVRRFTRRAGAGALAGTLLGMAGIAILPGMDQAGGFLTGLGFHGWGWLWPLLIPLIAAAVGFFATRWAALRMLRAVP